MPAYIPSNDLILDAEDSDLTWAGATEQTDQSADAAAAASQTTPEAAQPPAAATETPDAAKSTDDWRALLEDATDPLVALSRLARNVSREDLLRDPTLAGIVGD